MEDLNAEPPKRNWWYTISPCVIASFLAMGIIILGLMEGGYGSFGLFLGIPFLAIMVGIDFSLKYLLKLKLVNLWIVELVLIISGIIFIRVFFSGLF